MAINSEIKYRPKTLAEFVFPNEEVKELITAYAAGQCSRSLILAGTNGTGKSLLAALLPDAIEGKEAWVTKLEVGKLNSSEEIKKHFFPHNFYTQLFILNEQKFSYTVIEELNVAPNSNAFAKKQAIDTLKLGLDAKQGVEITIFTTNQLHNIDAGIRSRCEVLHVPACTPEVFLPRAKKIIADEGYQLEDELLLKALGDTYRLRPDNRSYYKLLDRMLRSV